MKGSEEIILRARATMDTCAGCRNVELFKVKNTYTAGYDRPNIHPPATRHQVQ